MTPVERLEKGWTREAWARRSDGSACSCHSHDAVCWCLAGASWGLNAKQNIKWLSACEIAIKELNPSLDYPGTFQWNDHPDRTQAEVIAVAKRAMEIMEAGK